MPSFSKILPEFSSVSEYPNQGSMHRKGAFFLVQIPKFGKSLNNTLIIGLEFSNIVKELDFMHLKISVSLSNNL